VSLSCQFFQERNGVTATTERISKPSNGRAVASDFEGQGYVLFSREHMVALVQRANHDSEFRDHGSQTGLSTSLTLYLEETETAWTVKFAGGEIIDLEQQMNGEFLISGKEEWWRAVFSNRIDPFLATQQGKLKLKRGELAKLSQWYKPFQRAFSIWQTIPIQ
jgi:putative sterol carrier protein